MKVVALNAGGRSHRAMLFDIDAAAVLPSDPPATMWEANDESAATHFADLIAQMPVPDIAVHRVVHGGLDGTLDNDAFIDDAVLAAIEAGREFAPGHNGLALDGITAIGARFGPQVRQIAIVDRALRDDAPAVATMLSGPAAWRTQHHMRRFGFHGISHHDVIARALARLGRSDARVVTVHIGSGCSLAAFRGSRAIDTTMGMTPLSGVMMAERAGDVDPGALIYLLRNGIEDVTSLEHRLNAESGLKGLSGVSADTREIYAAIDAGNGAALAAMQLFTYRLRLAVGALAAALGGIDALTFSGPAGEHMPRIRSSVCDGLAFLGIALDEARNADCAADADISTRGAGARTFVIRTLEEWAMVRRACALC